VPATLSGAGVLVEKRALPRNASPAKVSLLIGGFGLLLLLISGSSIFLNRLYRTQGRQVVATVTGTDAAYDLHHSQHSNIRYQFTVNGRTFRGNQTGYSENTGETMLVTYLPSYPSFNRVAGSEQQEQKALEPVAFAGLLFMLIAVQSYVVNRRKKAEISHTP
jgi:hypothetical protein